MMVVLKNALTSIDMDWKRFCALGALLALACGIGMLIAMLLAGRD